VEHVSQLLPAYALGVLDPAEAELVDRHVATCPQCAAELTEAQETAGMLAYAAPSVAPPLDLRARILDAVDEPERVVAPQPMPEPEPEPEPAKRSRPTLGWWPRFARVAVPVLAVCVIGLLAWNISLRHSLGQTNDAVYGASTSVALSNVGTVFVHSDGSATLYADAQALPSGHTYQAWVIPPGGKPISAGVFSAGRKNIDFATKAQNGDTLAISVEPSGGSPQPTTKPIAAGKVA
jgi:anti-sigma-K factor RskA